MNDPVENMIKQHASSPKFQTDLAQALESEAAYRMEGNIDSLNGAIVSWERLLNAPDFPSSDLNLRVSVLSRAGEVHIQRHWTTGDAENLERALRYWHDALQIIPPDSSFLPEVLNNLGIGLLDHYNLSRNISFLQQAIGAHERAVELTDATSQDMAVRLGNLGVALSSLFEQTGDRIALKRAIQVYEESIAHTPAESPDLAIRLNNLGTGLSDRYDITGEVDDLAKAIKAYQQAAELSSEDAPQLPRYLNNLATTLIDRYKLKGETSDLERAIEAYRKALKNTPENSPELPGRLNNLAIALRAEYIRAGKLSSLEEAKQAWESAVNRTPANSPYLARYLNNLANVLCDSYALTGKIEELERATAAYKRAVKHTSPGSPELARHLNGLGNGLKSLYEKTGDLSYLQQAIEVHQQSVSQTPSGSPERAKRLSNLAGSLRSFYIHTGDLSVLELSIQIYKAVVDRTPPESPDLPGYLNNLANGLRDYYERSQDVLHLKSALESLRTAIDNLNDGFPNLHSYFSNLGACLIDCFDRRGNLDELEMAIRVLEQALETAPPNALSLPAILNNLSYALRIRYHKMRSVADLDRALELAERAVELSKDRSTEMVLHTLSLANVLKDRYELASSANDAERARHYYREATRTGVSVAAHLRLTAARSWGAWALARQAWSEAVEAYDYATQASELLLRIQLVRENKEMWLRETQGLYARFAFALTRLGDLSRAVAALEQGQARLLSESLKQNSADLQSLRLSHPELYNSYIGALEPILRRERSRPDFKDISSNPAPIQETLADQSVLDQVLNNIREVSGYEHFLAPSSFDDVRNALSVLLDFQALIYIATTEAGSIALIVTRETIEALWSDFDELKLNALLTGGYANETKEGYLSGQFYGVERLKDPVQKALEVAGEHLIGALANRLRDMRIEDVVLIATGRLSLLPLHCAYYQVDGKVLNFLDDFTVTYSPNAYVLTEATREATRRYGLSLLAVGNPLPNPRPLNGADVEVQEIAAFFPEGFSKLFRGETATRSNLLPAIPLTTYLHFAGHCDFDMAEPLNSALQLSNQESLSLRDILYGAARPEKARLVVLSACQTAISDFRQLPDELIGFPAFFLQAGVPGVIGTLWPAQDLAITLLMIKFYEFHLYGDSRRKEAMTPVRALRQAQLWVRDITSGQLTDYYEHLSQEEAMELPITSRRSYAELLTRLSTFSLDDPENQPFKDAAFAWAPFVSLGV